MAAMLEAHGYPTLRAHGGQQAVELATRQAPSLILMDLRMPGMSGWETIGTLADNPDTAHIVEQLELFNELERALPARQTRF